MTEGYSPTHPESPRAKTPKGLHMSAPGWRPAPTRGKWCIDSYTEGVEYHVGTPLTNRIQPAWRIQSLRDRRFLGHTRGSALGRNPGLTDDAPSGRLKCFPYRNLGNMPGTIRQSIFPVDCPILTSPHQPLPSQPTPKGLYMSAPPLTTPTPFLTANPEGVVYVSPGLAPCAYPGKMVYRFLHRRC